MDFLEMLARRTAPPGTQFDLFDNTLPRRAAPPAGPTLQQVLAADPAQQVLPLRGRNPLIDMSLPGQQARASGRVVQAAPTPPTPPTLSGPSAPQQGVAPRVALGGPAAPQQTVLPRLSLKGPMAPQQTVTPQGAPKASPAPSATPSATPVAAAAEAPAAATVTKAGRFPSLSEVLGGTKRLLSGAGVGPVMPLSLKEITDVSMGGSNAEQDAAMENIRAAGAGVAEAWQQKGLDPTVKALFQGAKRIAFGAPGAAATPVVSAAPDTSPMREGTLQELLATPAPGAAAGATPQAAAAQAAPTNLLSQMEQVARAYPNMNLRQLIALTNALPATNGAGAAALAPSRGKDLIFEAAVSDYYQNLKELAAANLPPKEARIERSRLLSELIAAQNPQYGLLNPPEEE